MSRLLVLSLLMMAFCPQLAAQGPSKKPEKEKSRVVVGNVVKTKRASIQSFVGTLESIRRTTLGSAVEGRVVEVLFDEGDFVGMVEREDKDGEGLDEINGALPPQDGVAMMKLLTSTLDIEIRAAEIQAELTQQAAKELTISLPLSIRSAEANLKQSSSQLEFARSSYSRLSKLSQQSGALSQSELEESRSLYRSAQQATEAFTADLSRLKSTREIQLSQARSRIESAQQEVARLRDMRSKYTIRAPFPGFVTSKMTEVGAWINKGDAVAELVQLDPIEMIINVPQEYAQRLQQSFAGDSMQAEIVVNGIEKSVSGTVVGVIPQADLRSRSFPVRIRFDNVEAGRVYVFQPGMLGRANLLVGREREMLMVKKDALVLGRKNVIYKIVTEDKKEVAYPVTVETGTAVGAWVEVLGLVSPDDRIVIVGNERLRPGVEVEVMETRTEKITE